ncbi:hypothetical protein [Pseudomonas aeruginosa]|uniref:hypothetical protein n=1 Tax=Pseudomonas aeruginosa TaxID=287 RepID=UPI000F51BC7C|nr:hypothetical protein [Pseudomonas aeruginosa]RPN95878.1 hypothetical protein IPC1227_17890 [Pseudomonas aeruginosa]
MKKSMISCLCFVLLLHFLLVSKVAAEVFCESCLQVRVERPLVVRGGSHEPGLDTKFYVIKLSENLFRGYSSGGGDAYAITGPEAWSMGWPANKVLSKGAAGSYSECGVWINSPVKIGDVYVAAVHQEQKCDYINGGQTHKSMGVSFSYDGLSWVNPITVLTSPEAPKMGTQSGEGDCSLVRAPDEGYLYMYCFRPGRWDNIVARAPEASYMFPSSWRKLYKGNWSEPAIGGMADSFGAIGSSVGYWRAGRKVIALDLDPWFGGIKLSLSSDYKNFFTLKDPLVPFVKNDWDRNLIGESTDLIAYVGVVNLFGGGNRVDNSGWGITYTYIPHGGTLKEKYLVFQGVNMKVVSEPKQASVGLALTRWEHRSGKCRVTTLPVVRQSEYTERNRIAYLLTRPVVGIETLEVEECVNRQDPDDYLVTDAGGCDGSGHDRIATIGWVYKYPQKNTVPIYRCYSPLGENHFLSSNAGCDDLGSLEWKLGYGLK